MKSRQRIDQDLEYEHLINHSRHNIFLCRDLEISVEELQNDVKTKRCYVTMNDVESFALVLSTISRALVDLKSRHVYLTTDY